MKKKPPERLWVYAPTPPKFTSSEKAHILEKVKTEIIHQTKLSQKVWRMDMRANRIYLYHLVEQFKAEGAVFIKPLIDDKYIEFPYARITLNDKKGDNSTVDWQRHNNQWITFYSGTLNECLHSIEEDNGWFQ